MSIRFRYYKISVTGTLKSLMVFGLAMLFLNGCQGADQSNTITSEAGNLPSPTSSASDIPESNSSPVSSPIPIASVESTENEFDSDLMMPLNDTGRQNCFTEGDLINVCPVENYPGQDGELGRDVLAGEGNLIKQGVGAAGFDFTKLDGDGDVLSEQNSQWQCIKDNHTQLVWEVKSENIDHINFAEHTYTWFSSDPLINNSIAGTSDGGECNNLGCDTEAFVEAMNQKKYCGYSDWRLPTTTELASIVDYSRINKAIDSHFFPHQHGLRHWTLNTSSAIPQLAWYIYFSDGSSSFTRKDTPSYIRLVRSDAPPKIDFSDACDENPITSADRYSIVTDNEILDLQTNLIWQRCPIGFSWQENACLLSKQGMNSFTWQEALYAAEEYKGWRLPNIKELESLVDRQCSAPAISWRYFSDANLDSFWTATAAFFGEAWAIDFNNGGLIVTNKDKPFGIRLVKDN